MSIASWISAINAKNFWTDYIYLTNYYYEMDYFFQIHLPVTERYSLMVDIQSEARTLWLFDQKNKRELGYIDTDDQYFSVFRREELEVVSQAIGKNLSVNPNIPFLLLDLFTPTTSNDDFNITRSRLVSAWGSLHIFSDKELENLFDSYYKKRWVIEKDSTWKHTPNSGWVLRDKYNHCSLRVSQKPPYSRPFPFREFKNMIQDLC